MRTTLDLPIDLLNDAMKAIHAKTKTKVIIIALEELIRKSKIAELKEFKGKVDLDIDLNTIRGRQCQYYSILQYGLSISGVEIILKNLIF